MKKTVVRIISAVVIVALLVGALFYIGIPQYIIYRQMVIEAQVKHKDVKRIKLTSLENIVITNDGQSIEYLPDQEKFSKIKKILNNKRVKIIMPSGFVGYEEGYDQIELHTGENDYVLYGAVGGDAIFNTRYLVLYDYSNYNINEQLFQLIKVSDSDYKEIFEELDSSDEQNPDYSEIISDEQSDE